MSRYQEVIGCIHIHFPLSKLKKNLEPLGQEGNTAGLDFLIINSHTPEKSPSRYEQILKKYLYFGRTLVINAEETDDRKKQNHLLVIGGKRWYGNKDEVYEVISEGSKDGCLFFIAHPDGIHKLFLLKKEYYWEKWEVDGFTGIEVWSMLFDWARTTRIYNLPVRYLGFPHNLKGPGSSVLTRWDEISRTRKVVGISGLDIHLLPGICRIMDINRSFVYQNIFKVLRNHLLLKDPLTGNPEDDKKRIMTGLKNGNLFFANDLIADSSGFYFGSENEELIMGDTVTPHTSFIVKSPKKARIKLVFNGVPLWEEETALKKFTPGSPGIYRIEAILEDKPWVFTNHIHVK